MKQKHCDMFRKYNITDRLYKLRMDPVFERLLQI